jgi:PilZ domain-containing protein
MKTFEAQVPAGWQKAAVRAAEVAPATSLMEHRWGRRRPCRARVCVSAGGGLAGSGRLRNVSLSGAYLETALPLSLYSQIAVAVLRDDGSRACEFTATVARREPGGVGIEWIEEISGSICALLDCDADCITDDQQLL